MVAAGTARPGIRAAGLIAANAGNDAGEIATYASAGAQFGYQPLFLLVLITVALVVVQEMCARLGAYTGEGLGALIREQFSLRVTAFALLAFLVANVGLVVSEFAGIAAALELVGVTKFISIPVAAAAIWALVVYRSCAKGRDGRNNLLRALALFLGRSAFS
jgi:NRAMP (natural resistance-associated macrophage protein)-like metal ion transporter